MSVECISAQSGRNPQPSIMVSSSLTDGSMIWTPLTLKYFVSFLSSISLTMYGIYCPA